MISFEKAQSAAKSFAAKNAAGFGQGLKPRLKILLNRQNVIKPTLARVDLHDTPCGLKACASDAVATTKGNFQTVAGGTFKGDHGAFHPPCRAE